MWERFCFYGMRGMLVVFMVTQLGLDDKTANLQYGAIQAFVYAFTFIGGVFADKILGFQKSLFWGALLMIARRFHHRLLARGAVLHRHLFLHHRHGLLQAEHQHHGGPAVPRGRSAAAMRVSACSMPGINLGALLGGLLMVWVGKDHSWRAGLRTWSAS